LGPTASGGARASLVEVLWIVLTVAVALGVTALIAGRSSFYADDYVNFQDAFLGGYDLGYMAAASMVHFSPGDRLLFLVLQRHAEFNHNVDLAVLLAFNGAAMVAVQRIMRFWHVPVGWSCVGALSYGLSPLVFGTIEWFSAGLLVVPPTAFALAAVHAYLQYFRSHRLGWLVWSVIAFAGALLFYEKEAVIPVLLVLLRVLVLDDRPLRQGIRSVRDEWRTWAPYVLVLAVWFVVYRTRPYADVFRLAPLGDDLEYLGRAWAETLIPGALGLHPPGAGNGFLRAVQIVGAQAVLVAAIVVSVHRRPFAWRAWVLLALAFVLHNVLLLPRVDAFGPVFSAHVLRYQADLLPFVPIAFAAAFGTRLQVSSRPRRPGMGSAVAVMVAVAITVAAAANASAITDRSPGVRAKRWLANVRGDIARVQRPGATVNILDDSVPPWLIEWWVRPRSQPLSLNLPMFARGLTFDQPVDPSYRVQPDGHLERVTFRRALVRPGTCLRAAGTGFASLEIRPAEPLVGRRWYLRLSYTAAPMGVFIAVDRGTGYAKPVDRGLAAAPSPTSGLVALGELSVSRPVLRALRLDVPSGNRACFRRLEVGSFAPAAG
jgi:hypothetical protein